MDAPDSGGPVPGRKRRALLLLMHQGRSFAREIAAAAAACDVELVGLSSRPEHASHLAAARSWLADCLVTDTDQLGRQDVAGVVQQFAARGFAVKAAIATFEAYRLLMAALNEELGVVDSSGRGLALCLDKYELRQFLTGRGLSAVRSFPLDVDDPPDLDPGVPWFVKPVRGASSFAAFRLRDPADLADLPAIQRQMRADRELSSIFMDRYDFLVEEYVEGPEFSFEVLLLDGCRHVCVHEKARVERRARTTLEAMSVSPPVSVPVEVVLGGAAFVTRCFQELEELDVVAGAFHVEAKYWVERDRWEIIEINPRAGGSLIDASVHAVTGESIIALWVASLLATGAARTALRDRVERAGQLERLRRGTVTRGAVFVSKYGEKGRTVDSIRFARGPRPPAVLKVHARSGTVIEDSDRALCLMDALWEVDVSDLAAEVDFLDALATRNFDVRYR